MTNDETNNQNLQENTPETVPAEIPQPTEPPPVESTQILSTPSVNIETPSTEVVSVPILVEQPVIEPVEAKAAVRPKKEKPQKAKMNEEEFAPIWEELTTARDSETLMTVKCTRSIRGGALIDHKGLEGFIPMSHFELSRNLNEKTIEPFVGQMIDVTVIEMSSREERRFVCSRKNALKKSKFDSMKKGMVVEGTVTSITDYGVFVDLGGIDGLVHISRLSKVRVNHPSDVVKPKQLVKVTIVDVDYKKERIALSMKEFTESPWARVAEKYVPQSIHKGKIRNITSFGVYVQLEPGVDGMVHVSDLSWTKRLNSPDELVKVGQELEVKVLEVNPDKQRIALSVKETQPDPWPRLANIYPVGTESEAKIKLLMPAGAVVELPFDVDGFVPRGKMGPKGKKGGRKESSYTVGDAVRVQIVDIDIEGRSLICSIAREEQVRETRSEKERDDLKQAASDRAFTLGDIAGLKEMFRKPESTPSAPVENMRTPEPSQTPEPPDTVEAISSPVVSEPVQEPGAEVQDASLETPAVAESLPESFIPPDDQEGTAEEPTSVA